MSTKQAKNNDALSTGRGLAVGVAIGVALSVATGNWAMLGVGVAIGVALSLSLRDGGGPDDGR